MRKRGREGGKEERREGVSERGRGGGREGGREGGKEGRRKELVRKGGGNGRERVREEEGMESA